MRIDEHQHLSLNGPLRRHSSRYSCGAIAAVLAALAVGCDGAPPAPAPDAAVDDAAVLVDGGVDASAFVVAPHRDSPQVPYLGGATLTHPRVVTITYANDTNAAALEAHAAWLVGDGWLETVGAEYGIGAGTILGNVRLTENAPTSTTSDAIETHLAALLADGTLPRAPDGSVTDVLYVIYFPVSTTITDPQLGDSCRSYGGYHYEITSGAETFSYAVVPNCPDFNPGLTPLQSEEATVAHELIEAATDARPTTRPAWTFDQNGLALSPWLFVGPELADLCALRVAAVSAPMESGFTASRVWSNAAAAANDRDPCVPSDPSVPYYAVTVSPDTVQRVAAGDTVTYELEAWTSAPMPPFRLWAVASGGTFTPTISMDRTFVTNGDHATVTLGVPAGTAAGSYALVYVETVASDTDYNAVPLVVYLP